MNSGKNTSLKVILFIIILVLPTLSWGHVPPRPGLYDAKSGRSVTTGDPYPVFPEGVDEPAALNLERTGSPDKALVILIQTPDVSGTHSRESFHNMLFTTGSYPTGSLNDYFAEVSYGTFGLTGEVGGWYTAANNYAHYTGGGNYGMGTYPYNAQALVEEAVDAAEAGGVDFSQYDNDSDGYVDGLIIVHQGPGAESTGSLNDIWSHQWALRERRVYDGVTITLYSMNPELRGEGTAGEMQGIRVFAHEYSHLLGCPDLYDYDGKMNTDTYNTPNDENDHPLMDWCLMGYYGYSVSSYGADITPTHLCGYMKNFLGWITPTVLDSSHNNVQINEIETTLVNALYKIPINSSLTEYFLIENRNSASSALFDHYDSDFSAWFEWFTPGPNPLDAGLLITHVDEDIPSNSGNRPHYRVVVEDAGYDPAKPWDAVGEFSEWWYPWEFKIGACFSAEDGQTEFTSTTTPNTAGYNESSGIQITNIGNSGSVMTFDIACTGVPAFAVADLHVDDTGGDGDAFPDPGETVDVTIDLQNVGSAGSENITGTLSSPDLYVTIINATASFGAIDTVETKSSQTPYRLSVESDCPINREVFFLLTVACQGCDPLTVSFTMTIGLDRVFADDMESGSGAWLPGAITPGYHDQWHQSTYRNHTLGGTTSWKCGGPESEHYANTLDAGLVSPIIDLSFNTTLTFWHWIDMEVPYDGALVEINDGDGWTLITPKGGYPYFLTDGYSGNPFPGNTPIYSGSQGWSEAEFDLTDYYGPVRFRFRAGSDTTASAEGWYIDDVQISVAEDLKGDINNDGTVNVMDVVLGVNIIIGLLDPHPSDRWAADFNGDDSVDVVDLVLTIMVILSSPE
ncbi:MAG: M6 family metalloprotease domain-containing protein [Gemmatimonadota bacterium]|nr:MAG: M6 family metalloprotease domain-containing protein [Gemmatimonadota bacterium]